MQVYYVRERRPSIKMCSINTQTQTHTCCGHISLVASSPSSLKRKKKGGSYDKFIQIKSLVKKIKIKHGASNWSKHERPVRHAIGVSASGNE